MKKITNFATILIVSTVLQSQTTIFVKPSGTGDGTSWANACNLETAVASTPLSDRTEIWVQKGTYYPTKMLVVPDSVKIYGGFSGTENNLSQRNFVANPTIVDGQQKVGSIFRLGTFSELNGFTVQNGNANGTPQKNGGGVWADDNAIVENCKIINNAAILNGGGVYAKGKTKIINSTVENNVATDNGNDMFGNCIRVVTEQATFLPNVTFGCNNEKLDLGNVSFVTSQTWKISVNGVNQEWSDAVLAEGCNKTTYNGGTSGNYHSDCRSNTDRSVYGDFFSWCAVFRYADVLCPEGWRVPTAGDFFDLDQALGGNGDGTGPGDWFMDEYGKYYTNETIRDNYLNVWGGSYSGTCNPIDWMGHQGMYARFWTQSEFSFEQGFHTDFYTMDGIRTQNYIAKSYGCVLRCVK